MSWSVSYIGKPEKIAEALQGYSTSMSAGQSKLEFDAALPHLTALVKENFGNENQLLKFSASGSGYSINDEQKTRMCSVSIETFYAVLV